MTSPDFTHAMWRKSTRSGDNGGQCVEVAFLQRVVGLRDFEDGKSGPVLIFAQSEWEAFVAGAVEGKFGRG